MAGIESLSFCGPMLPFQPPPPMAHAPIPHAPIPIGVIWRSLFPRLLVSMIQMFTYSKMAVAGRGTHSTTRPPYTFTQKIGSLATHPLQIRERRFQSQSVDVPAGGGQ